MARSSFAERVLSSKAFEPDPPTISSSHGEDQTYDADPSVMNMCDEVLAGSAQFDTVIVPCCDDILCPVNMPTDRCMPLLTYKFARTMSENVACHLNTIDVANYSLH